MLRLSSMGRSLYRVWSMADEWGWAEEKADDEVLWHGWGGIL